MPNTLLFLILLALGIIIIIALWNSITDKSCDKKLNEKNDRIKALENELAIQRNINEVNNEVFKDLYTKGEFVKVEYNGKTHETRINKILYQTELGKKTYEFDEIERVE